MLLTILIIVSLDVRLSLILKFQFYLFHGFNQPFYALMIPLSFVQFCARKKQRKLLTSNVTSLNG